MKKKILSIMLTALISLLLIACNKTITQEQDTKDNVRFQDDFYEYVNSDLLDLIDLDENEAEWTWFSELSAASGQEMRQIISDLKDSSILYEKGSSEQKIRDLYECVSDVENRNATGLGQLQPYLDSIQNANTIQEYEEVLFHLSGEYGFSSIVGGYYIGQDKKDSTKYAVYMMYADTLIGKEYLESQDTQEYVTMYFDYVEKMLEEYGMSKEEAQTASAEIEVLLRDICAASLSTEKYYDPNMAYNVYTKDDLQKLFTNVDVEKMLEILRLDTEDSFIVTDVSQAQKVNSLLVEENLDVLKDFSTFVLLNDIASYSTQGYDKLSKDIKNQLYGIGAKDDWFEYCEKTQELLPWDFGSIYIKNHFSEKNKQNVEDMIDEILQSYIDIIDRQEWMSDDTKAKARRKLETINVKIGYPDEWPESMEMMQVTPVSEGGSLLSNLLENMQVTIEENLKKLERDVDCSEWDMPPQTVNAYYDSGKNEIVFPAAILQKPFYDEKNTVGANLGGIGFVIAHEISHAFDANGALYDEYGNYNVWWTEEEMAEYSRLSESIVDYYNQYAVAGGKVNGALTLSENIADLGAITCITSILGDDTEALQDAFEQMAYIWASEETVSYQLYLLNKDTHSPNKVRVNATLSSCDAFYEAYDIQESDGMYVDPKNRVGIWK